MDPGKMVPAKNPVFQNRFLILFCLTIFTIILNLTGLMAGITMVLPHLFYIPIILAGYWYPRRGIHFSVMIALVYGLLVLSFPSTSPDTVIATLSRMVIFVVIGGVVSFLSHRLSESEQQLNDIIEFLPDATFAIDREGRVIAWNRAVEELAGKMKREMLSRGNYEYSLAFYPDRRPMLAGLLIRNEVDIEAKYPAIHYESANSIKHQVGISREFRDLGTLPPSWVPVQSAVRDAAGRLDLKHVVVRAWTERLEVFSDPHLPAVFYHLIHNSLKDETGATRIIITYQVQDEGCVIFVEDDGTGVPDTDKERLFLNREEGSGHGLFLSSEILSITGITIRETGTSGRGARFEICVPSEGYRIEGVES